ncbi:Abi family protein [Corynebacterium auriscanis]|uniref:Abi family protein n=1 Tax=Corynebacterium auriscanis TaxID=99807 RepID=UPI000B228C48
MLGAITQRTPHPRIVPTTAYCKWLEEHDRHERRARGDFVLHFREHYGPHLPIWVVTEVMSFGLLSNLYKLMRQNDQEILAARFQVHSADGRGDRGAPANWLNCLRNVRNICAHYGRVWNRGFDVLIDAPWQTRRRKEDLLAPLVDNGVNNRLYGVLLVMRYLILSIDPDNGNGVDIASYIDERSRHLGFRMGQLGFPEGWRKNPLWDRGFEINREPMVAASLLDRVETLTAPQTRESLISAEPRPTAEPRTPDQWAAAKRAAQKDLLRAYGEHEAVIEVELGGLRYYPSFQFRDGKTSTLLLRSTKSSSLRAHTRIEPTKLGRC